jgi:hypothetical protein
MNRETSGVVVAGERYPRRPINENCPTINIRYSAGRTAICAGPCVRIGARFPLSQAVKQAVPHMPHRGFNPAACFDIWLATFHILQMLYNTPFPVTPQTDRAEKTERNAEIMARYKSGETGARLAQTFGISEQRINQIVRGRRK